MRLTSAATDARRDNSEVAEPERVCVQCVSLSYDKANIKQPLHGAGRKHSPLPVSVTEELSQRALQGSDSCDHGASEGSGCVRSA